MTAALLLDRLDGVKQTGRGRWLARCPAHEDRYPSLSILELDDGRTLVHCFAGCATADVLAAVGLGFEDLFPERAKVERARSECRPWRATDVVRALEADLAPAFIFLCDVTAGRPVTDADRTIARDCAERVARFLEEIRHAR